MKILILGGSGFLGSHVADELSDHGHEAIIFDKEKSPFLRKDQKFIQGDLRNIKSLGKAIKGCEIVYNFAALADLDIARLKPLGTVENNILGTINVLIMCQRLKIKKIIHASTIYANSHVGGFYAVSKRCAEDYIEEFKKTYGLNYIILRFGSLYGDRADKNNGIKKIIVRIAKNKELVYKGSSKASRKYIHAKDAAKICVKVLNKKFNNSCLHITGKKSIRVYKMFKFLSKKLKIKKKQKFLNEKNTGHYDINPAPYKLRKGRKLIVKNERNFYKSIFELIEGLK